MKPKYKKGDEVVYGEGNWKYIVSHVIFEHGGVDEDGEYDGPKEVRYVLICNDEVCVCPGDETVPLIYDQITGVCGAMTAWPKRAKRAKRGQRAKFPYKKVDES